MKNQLLTIAALACITVAGSAMVIAKPTSHEDSQSAKQFRSFAQLNLSDQQKQDMRAIFKTTRENNSVYAGEKKEIMTQMQSLMNLPAWEQDTAETIIRSQIQQSQNIALNRAKARNQAYNLLSDEQKNNLAEMDVKYAHKKLSSTSRVKHNGDDSKKFNRTGNAGKISMARFEKALQLSDSQVAQFRAIKANAKQQLIGLKQQGEDHQQMMKLIVQSPSFDENAWITARNAGIQDMISYKLIKTKAQYDRVSLLSDEQKQKFSKMFNKMRNKRANGGSVG